MGHLRTGLVLTFLAGVAALLLGGIGGGSRLAGVREDELNLFTRVLDVVRSDYLEPVDEHRLVLGAVRGLLAELDPNSAFLDRDAYAALRGDASGEVQALGIEITKRRDGSIEVVSPVDGTPAAKADIRARDQIDSICPADPTGEWSEECRSSESMTLFEAVRLLSGPKGSKVTIQVLRRGFDVPQPYTLVREVVKVRLVEGRMLEPRYPYVRIRAFREGTLEDLERALQQLHEEADDSFEGLILDLRNNPGGLLEQAARVADVWLTEGLLAYTEGRIEGQRREFRAHAAGTEPSYPVTVLVNAGTAGSSEILAGALKDHQRALIVGTKTFGRGSVQTLYPLEGGGRLGLTTALYYTPSGRPIREVGITPDIAVGAVLAWEAPKDPAAPRRATPEPDLGEDGLEGGRGAQSDVQLDRALEALKSRSYFEGMKGGQKAGELQASAGEGASGGDQTPF
jgi:carboxyl-terminal processing protease